MRQLKVTVRMLFRHPAYTLITVFGLAIGLAMGMMAMSYVIREMRWEDCHVYHNRIHRVEMQYRHADTVWADARIMAPLATTLAGGVSGIEKVAVFERQRNVSLQVDHKTSSAGPLIFAGPDFFDVFTFPLKIGDPTAALRNPNSVLITDSIAKVYFAGRDPIGKTIIINEQTEYQITGILEDVPATTQLHCDFIASYSTLRSSGAESDSWAGEGTDYAYILLRGDADPNSVRSQIAGLFSRHVPEEVSQRYSFTLKPLKDIYFDTYYSGNRGELWPGGEYDVMIIIVCIGLFILIQSIVNFISLSTARGADRMKEVGVRKTFGAARSRLIVQFAGEAMIPTFLATIIGLAFYDIFRKGFTIVTPDKIALPNLYGEPGTVLYVVLFAVITGILAGYYPALYLSRFRPISILSGGATAGPSPSLLRKSLVVFQFTLAIFFISVTVGHYQQVDFLTHYDLGFDSKNTMVLRFPGDASAADDCVLAKHEILARNEVLGATRTSGVMGSRFGESRYYTDPERVETERRYAIKYVVDYDFLSFYGIEVIKGRGFSPNKPEEIDHAILINESMADRLDLANPIGQTLYTDSATWRIVGVVRDFHGISLNSRGSTSIITLNPDACRVLSVKLRPDDISGSVAAVECTWKRVFGDREFVYSFLEDDIRAEYWELDSIVSLFGAISVVSIMIACLGIFGLVSYTVERRTREMAIRKVLGASASSISQNLTREFLSLIALSNLIACPLAYLMMNYSLEEFPYRTTLGAVTYVSGGILTIVLMLAASGYHVIKAARANPSDALRYQ